MHKDETMLKHYSIRDWFLAGLVLVTLALTFKLAIDDNMHKAVDDPLDGYMHYWYTSMYGHNMAIALSNLEYGLDGYIGYRKVLEAIQAGALSNKAIQESIKLEDVASEGIFRQTVMDIGHVDYMSLAFKIFGYETESLLYLYFLLLFIVVSLFYSEFRTSNLAILILLLFLLAHYIVVAAVPVVGFQLDAVHNFRFLTVLAILPMIHISLIVLLRKKLNKLSFFVVLVQASVIIFAIWIRSSALWIMLFFAGLSLLTIVQIWIHRAQRSIDDNGGMFASVKQVFDQAKNTLWPIFIALGLMVLMNTLKPYILDQSYYDGEAGQGHTFWEVVYQGLQTHPDIGNKYGKAEVDINSWYNGLCGESETYPRLTLKWICTQTQRFPYLRSLYLSIMREPSDQETFNTMFQWLKDNGESELSAFTFRPGERVDLRASFIWFNLHSDLDIDSVEDSLGTVVRAFTSSDHINGEKREFILNDVIQDVVKTHPWQILELITVIKPLRLLNQFRLYYLKGQNSPPFLLVLGMVVALFFLARESSICELKSILMVLLLALAFSLIIPFMTYSIDYSLSAIALLTFLCIFSYSILFFNYLLGVVKDRNVISV
jgi:hypothetical protein